MKKLNFNNLEVRELDIIEATVINGGYAPKGDDKIPGTQPSLPDLTPTTIKSIIDNTICW